MLNRKLNSGRNCVQDVVGAVGSILLTQNPAPGKEGGKIKHGWDCLSAKKFQNNFHISDLS